MFSPKGEHILFAYIIVCAKSDLFLAVRCDEVDVLRLICQGEGHHWVLVLSVFSHLPRTRQLHISTTVTTTAGKQQKKLLYNMNKVVGTSSIFRRALTRHWVVDRVQHQTGNRGHCCQEDAWWQSAGSSQPWSGLWISENKEQEGWFNCTLKGQSQATRCPFYLI